MINAVTDTLKPIVDGIATAVQGVSTAVWQALPEWIRDAILFLGELAGKVWSQLWEFVRDPIGSIQAGLDWVTTTIGDALAAVSKTLGDGIATVGSTLGDAVNQVGSAVQTGLTWVVDGVTTAFNGAMSTVGGWLADALAGVASALGEGLKGFLDWLWKSLKSVGEAVATVVSRDIIEPIWTGLSGFASWLSGLLLDAVNAVSAALPGPGHTPAPEIVEGAWRTMGLTASVVAPLAVAAVAGELVHPLKELGLGRVSAIMYDLGGFRTIVNEIMSTFMYVGTVLPLRYALYELYTPLIPREEELLRFTERGVLDEPEFKYAMKKAGFSGYWADLFWRTHWRYPREDTLIEMLRREAITQDKFIDQLAYAGYPADIQAAYAELVRRIPDPRDLITMVVREVISPEDFYRYMPLVGYYDPWPQYYWEMHWILLPLGEVKRARHRGFIDDDELGKFLVLHDYKPEPRPGIRTSDRDLARLLVWDLPGRIDTRWLFRWGLINVAQIEELLVKDGMDPAWAPLVAEAYAKQQLATEINRLRDNIKADLRDGWTSEEEARSDLAELGYPPGLIDYHIADALRDRERQHKKRLLDLWEDGYIKDLLTDEELLNRAKDLIVDEDALHLFLDEAWIKKYRKPKGGVGD
ncbi:MAG: hypothetical protein JRE40_01720 [Deltaproteobacteria bacterium]|nr:hypothetical protein [Deltaproteobacteria bacterium]MBW2672511.1 hypothetical protein [Deltaproteobacteria bacterium]